MNAEDPREQAAVAALLASLPWAWRICPRCHSLGYIRTSRRVGQSHRICYLKCRNCGFSFKRGRTVCCKHTTKGSRCTSQTSVEFGTQQHERI